MTSVWAASGAGAETDTDAILTAAAASRWSRPDLTATLGRYAADQAGTDDRAWAAGAGWAVHGRSAIGDGRQEALEFLRELGQRRAALDGVAGTRLSAELAGVARDHGARSVAYRILDALLSDPATPVDVRFDALVSRARASLSEGREPLEGLLERIDDAAGDVPGAGPRATAALLRSAAERAQGRHHTAADLARRAMADLGFSPRQAADATESDHLTAALATQWIGALMDAGAWSSARQAADEIAPRLDVVATPSRQLAQLRLTWARATSKPSRTVAALTRAADDAAASGAPDLEAACRAALAELHDSAGRPGAARAERVLQAAADRTDREREQQFRGMNHVLGTVMERLLAGGRGSRSTIPAREAAGPSRNAAATRGGRHAVVTGAERAAAEGTGSAARTDGRASRVSETGDRRAAPARNGNGSRRTTAAGESAGAGGVNGASSGRDPVTSSDGFDGTRTVADGVSFGREPATPPEGIGAVGVARDGDRRSDARAARSRSAGGGDVLDTGSRPAQPNSSARRRTGASDGGSAARSGRSDPVGRRPADVDGVATGAATHGRPSGRPDQEPRRTSTTGPSRAAGRSADTGSQNGSRAAEPARRRPVSRLSGGSPLGDSLLEELRRSGSLSEERWSDPGEQSRFRAWTSDVWTERRRDADRAPAGSTTEPTAADRRTDAGTGRDVAHRNDADARPSDRTAPEPADPPSAGHGPNGRTAPVADRSAGVNGRGAGPAADRTNGQPSRPMTPATGEAEPLDAVRSAAEWLSSAIAEIDRIWGAPPADAPPEPVAEPHAPAPPAAVPSRAVPSRAPGRRRAVSGLAVVVFDLVAGDRRVTDGGARAVVRRIGRRVGADLPAGARLTDAERDSVTVELPDTDRGAAAAWVHSVLAELSDDLPAGRELDGAYLRAVICDADGVRGAQILHELATTGDAATAAAPTATPVDRISAARPARARLDDSDRTTPDATAHNGRRRAPAEGAESDPTRTAAEADDAGWPAGRHAHRRDVDTVNGATPTGGRRRRRDEPNDDRSAQLGAAPPRRGRSTDAAPAGDGSVAADVARRHRPVADDVPAPDQVSASRSGRRHRSADADRVAGVAGAGGVRRRERAADERSLPDPDGAAGSGRRRSAEDRVADGSAATAGVARRRQRADDEGRLADRAIEAGAGRRRSVDEDRPADGSAAGRGAGRRHRLVDDDRPADDEAPAGGTARRGRPAADGASLPGGAPDAGSGRGRRVEGNRPASSGRADAGSGRRRRTAGDEADAPVAPPTAGRSRHATRDTPPARPDDMGDRDVPAGRARGGRTTAAAAFGHDTDRPARTAGALFDDTPTRRHDDHSRPQGATGPVVTAPESADRSARRHRGGARSTLDDADFGADGASRVRRNQQTSPTSGSTPDDAEESADRRGGDRRIEAVADAAEPAGRRAVRGPDPAPDDTGQRVTGADAFRRARSTPDDDRSRPTDQDAASDRAEPSGDRPADVEPDIDKLGLADLLAGAMAAYRGL